MGKNNKYLMIGLAVVAILLVVAIASMLSGQNKQEKPTVTKLASSDEAIPTVDSSVSADLKTTAGGKEVILTVEGIPTGTETIEYELSYETAEQGIQGVVGTVTLDNDSTLERKITLGTCSTGGKCVFHKVVGMIKMILKFTGEYGEKLLEEEVSI